MLIVDIPALVTLIKNISLEKFYQMLVSYMREDFMGAQRFNQCPRVSFHHPDGILELMPICDNNFFSNKYVCTHKFNHEKNRYVVMGQGLWVDAHTGTPLMLTEMTLLTAIRTAAVSLMMSELMLKPDAQTIAIIGCGAQSDFQLMAHHQRFKFKNYKCFDIDAKAMQRLVSEMADEGVTLTPCKSAEEAVRDSDLVITVTNAQRVYPVLKKEWLKKGVHINAMGGDAPGASELDRPILLDADIIVVEYLPQTMVEGEIQQLNPDQHAQKVVEISDFLISGYPPETSKNCSIFDGVGIALLDFSCMRLVWDLCHQYNLGTHAQMLPPYKGDKNLFQYLEGVI